MRVGLIAAAVSVASGLVFSGCAPAIVGTIAAVSGGDGGGHSGPPPASAPPGPAPSFTTTALTIPDVSTAGGPVEIQVQSLPSPITPEFVNGVLIDMPGGQLGQGAVQAVVRVGPGGAPTYFISFVAPPAIPNANSHHHARIHGTLTVSNAQVHYLSVP